MTYTPTYDYLIYEANRPDLYSGGSVLVVEIWDTQAGQMLPQISGWEGKPYYYCWWYAVGNFSREIAERDSASACARFERERFHKWVTDNCRRSSPDTTAVCTEAGIS